MKNETISIKEATKQVEVAMTRLALMHLSFSKILVEELGEEKGKELIVKSIFEYGKKIAKVVAKGGQDLPKFGVHSGGVSQDEAGQFVVSGCILAKVFREFNALELGSLYCYVDPAKSMAADIKEKIIHRTCEACGDDKCTLAIIKTTEDDRQAYENQDEKLKYINPYLIEK